jgi:excisionase family DNA binding protein
VSTRKYMRVAEAAEVLGVSAFTIYGWVRARAIPFRRINGTVLIPREWVNDGDREAA